jgi:hypothetical protein
MSILMLALFALLCVGGAWFISADPARKGLGRLPLPPAAQRMLAQPAGPTVLALLLAALSLPIVSLSLDAVSAPRDVYLSTPIYLAPTDPGRWLSAAGSVFSAALVAGAIGGLLVRRHARVGAILTFLLAWEIALIALPVVPALLHLDIGFAYVCLDSCGVAIESSDPTNGLRLAVLPWAVEMSPLFAPASFVALVGGVVAWTRLLRRSSGVS